MLTSGLSQRGNPAMRNRRGCPKTRFEDLGADGRTSRSTATLFNRRAAGCAIRRPTAKDDVRARRAAQHRRETIKQMKPRDVLLALTVMAMWALNFPISKLGFQDFPPILFMALRFALVAMLL